MPKNKAISFHRDFKAPNAKDRKSALGSFPFQHKSNSTREEMLTTSAKFGQPSLEEKKADGGVDPSLAINDLNDKKLFIPTTRSETSFAISKPRDELDWLAQVPEEGETFDDYVSHSTTRTTGRIRPIANVNGLDILLLPIITTTVDPRRSSADGAVTPYWPTYGPSLAPLVQYTKVFFDRNVRILPAAQVYISGDSNNDRVRNTKKRRVTKQSNDVGAFAKSSKKFKFFLPDLDGNYSSSVEISGRSDLTSDRMQIQVTSLLDELAGYRCNRHATASISAPSYQKDFCIMGITMIDLFDSPKDLFCAGMAFGGSKVAAFSFHRYHPFLKMHPQQWHNYGYSNQCDGYSYYDDCNQSPNLTHDPPSIFQSPEGSSNPSSSSTTKDLDKVRSEYFRRCGKLMTHELGHLFVLDHCIHNRCLMNGTGHLVEDFNAPSHLCGVCLRKLQWRTGFDVRQRYKLLAKAYNEMKMTKEKGWVNKQYNHLI
mmetsp:Transcript_30683/g.35256  ORF Transcript_30683/g.35256 Transcript_30683/m.35256 type:complete len:484 (-) Transcript_30683:36-1487(-)